MIAKVIEESLDGIAYQIRPSKRARRLRINIRPDRVIEVVIPYGHSQTHAREFFQQNLPWVQQQIQRHQLDQPRHCPEQVELQSISERWHIHYEPHSHYRLQESPGQLLIRGPEQDFSQCSQLLKKWLRLQARRFLPDRLYDLSEQMGMHYQRVTIRSQQSRWGSCSSRGTISLNDRLMLLPASWVDYVLVHELCHTEHMNHSPAFWRRVADFYPDYQQAEQGLNKAQYRLPDWVV